MSAKLCPCWSLAYYAMRSYLTHALALSLSLIRVFVWVSGCFQIFADFSIFMNDLILYFHPRSVNSRGAIKWKSNQIKEFCKLTITQASFDIYDMMVSRNFANIARRDSSLPQISCQQHELNTLCNILCKDQGGLNSGVLWLLPR